MEPTYEPKKYSKVKSDSKGGYGQLNMYDIPNNLNNNNYESDFKNVMENYDEYFQGTKEINIAKNSSNGKSEKKNINSSGGKFNFI